jgi:hypothetical protein
MLKIIGYDIWRGGEKAGWIDGKHIRAHDGKKLGYFEGNHIYNMEGHRIGYVEGDFLYAESFGNTKISLDKISEDVVGGVLTEIGKCAIYMLLGG